MMPLEIHRQIREAGFTPAQRNTNYDIVKVFDTPESEQNLKTIEDITTAASKQGNWAELTLLD